MSKRERSRLMSKIRSKDTTIEREFKKRHEKAISHPDLPFHPDFCLDGKAIFLDSSFWHCSLPRKRFDKLPRKWQRKLANNLIRDISATVFYGENCERISNKLVESLVDE